MSRLKDTLIVLLDDGVELSADYHSNLTETLVVYGSGDDKYIMNLLDSSIFPMDNVVNAIHDVRMYDTNQDVRDKLIDRYDDLLYDYSINVQLDYVGMEKLIVAGS